MTDFSPYSMPRKSEPESQHRSALRGAPMNLRDFAQRDSLAVRTHTDNENVLFD